MSAFNEIFLYLVQTATTLYMVAVLLRFLLQLVRADFYNPISQFLVRVTNPVLLPLRKVVPGVRGLDLASLLLAVLLQLLSIVLVLVLHGVGLPGPAILLAWSLIGIAGLVVNIYFFSLLAVIVLSWIAPGSHNPALHLLHQVTEPVMVPFRKALPPMGGLDFSPILVFILINVLQIALRHMAAGVGLPTALVIGL